MHRRSSRKRRKSRYDESCSKVHHSAPNLPNRRGTQTLCTEPSLSHDKKCFDPVFEGETDLLERMASVEAGMSAELTTEEFQVMSRNVEQILSEARKTLAHHHDDRSVLAKPEGVKSTKGPSVLRDIEQKRKEVLPKTLQREGDKMKCIKQQKAKVLSLEDLEPAPEFPALSDTARARVVNSPYENFYSDLITGEAIEVAPLTDYFTFPVHEPERYASPTDYIGTPRSEGYSTMNDMEECPIYLVPPYDEYGRFSPPVYDSPPDGSHAFRLSSDNVSPEKERISRLMGNESADRRAIEREGERQHSENFNSKEPVARGSDRRRSSSYEQQPSLPKNKVHKTFVTESTNAPRSATPTDKCTQYDIDAGGVIAARTQPDQALQAQNTTQPFLSNGGDDPLVVGLWRHLALQELSLDLNSLISQYAAEGDSGIQDMIVPQNVQDDDDYENSGVASTLPESTLQFTSGVPGTGAFDSLTSSPSNDSAEGIIMNESSSSA
ncbi:uncharacterized protein LOC135400852 isoform X1 [Ornithodoros turicata]|uniref:uncharacterized protein LOC135400852 isoform X1 n=1 Tax=Ornithodoros turicata TaxID=34597 RepID=UPI00313A3312